MDRVLFLNSRGGIISRYPHLRSEEPLPVAPYVENVAIPVVSVDSSALCGDHPENMAVLTCSSGAALTFFCDSVAGGNDSSGDGSHDNPWRSLKTASRFLSCTSGVLNAAAPYIQLKIRGTVDYVSSGWAPWGALRSEKLILTGWGEKCDLGSAEFAAGYFFDLKAHPHYSAVIACSNCTVISNSAVKSLAVDCELVSGALVSCAYNCSGSTTNRLIDITAAVCCAGSFASPVSARYIYGTVISASFPSSWCALTVLNAAVGVSVTAVNSGTDRYASAIAIYAGASCSRLGNCTVIASAAAPPVTTNTQAYAHLLSGGPSGLIVSGGTWQAYASAVASGTSDRVNAAATAAGFASHITAANVSTTLVTSAGARLVGANGEEREYEATSDAGRYRWTQRVRMFSNGVVTSSYTSSGTY